MIRHGHGSGVGCCGELVQGTLPDGCEFQITLPIDRASHAAVELAPAAFTTVEVSPTGRTKAARALALAVSALGSEPYAARLSLADSLPVGAGLGSSTADIVATVRAVAGSFDSSLSPDRIGELAGAVEPSDGTMFPGIAVVDRRGRLLEALPWWPSFHVVVLVPRATRDTATIDLAAHRANAARYRELLDQVVEGAERRDVAAFVDAARVSADLHQDVVPNEFVPLAPSLARRTGAVGWNVAHTGSALGLLYDDADVAAGAMAKLRRQIQLAGVRLLSATTPSSVVEAFDKAMG